MALDALNSSPALKISRRFDDLPSQWPQSNRSKRFRRNPSEVEYLADCIVMLARSSCGGGAAGNISPATASSESDVNKHRENPPPAEAATGKSYKCSLCGKVYSRYQSLGSHMTKHHREPAAAASSRATAAKSGRLHECSICRKTFSSGQALGGHKRKHFDGVIGRGSSKSRSASSDTGEQMSVSVVRNFDLNMPPSPELQCDEEVESALPPLDV